MSKISFLFNGVGTLRGYAMIHVGVLLAKAPELLRGISVKRAVLIFVGACSLLLSILCGCGTVGSYHGPFALKMPFYVFAGIAGWFLLISLYRLVSAYQRLSTLISAVTYIGQHTMPVLIFHFLVFKMVNYVGVLCLGDPVEMIAAFPTAYRGIWWAVVYTLVGVALPLELNALYVRFKRCMLCC